MTMCRLSESTAERVPSHLIYNWKTRRKRSSSDRWPPSGVSLRGRTGRCGVSPLERGVDETLGSRGKAFTPLLLRGHCRQRYDHISLSSVAKTLPVTSQEGFRRKRAECGINEVDIRQAFDVIPLIAKCLAPHLCLGLRWYHLAGEGAGHRVREGLKDKRAVAVNAIEERVIGVESYVQRLAVEDPTVETSALSARTRARGGLETLNDLVTDREVALGEAPRVR